MAYNVRILKDSISPDGVRLTTFEVTMPRIVLAEFNTHRMFSRNSASSRAIPVKKSIEMVDADPFFPQNFARNERGMQGNNPLEEDDAQRAREIWADAMEDALYHAFRLERIGLHKALANRILEPFKWHTIIVTATEWDNFFALRTDENAQAEIRIPAQMMLDQYRGNEPTPLEYGQWHIPLVDFAEELKWTRGKGWNFWKKISVGRCARVSYLTHDGKRDLMKDIELHDRLLENGHLSPFEHVATPMRLGVGSANMYGNFHGWRQYRKDILHEDNFGRTKDS